MVKLFVLLLSLATLMRTGFCIQCFRCSSSGPDESCKYVSRSKWSSSPNEAESQQCYTTEKVPGKFCVKASGYVGNEWQVTRGCSATRMERRGTFSFEGHLFTDGRITSCETNFCNSSGLPTPNIVLTTIFALFYFIHCFY